MYLRLLVQHKTVYRMVFESKQQKQKHTVYRSMRRVLGAKQLRISL